MTEAEWFACTDPDKMLAFLRESGRATDRKFRLFGVACCRRIWHLMDHRLSREAVEVAERFADGVATNCERGVAEFDSHEAPCGHGDGPALAAYVVVSEDASFAGEVASRYASGAMADAAGAEASAEEDVTQVALVRCLFGNPFRPPALLDPRWAKSTALSLAKRAYEDRMLPSGHIDPARLVDLAAALAAAGCTDAELLAHLRSPGPHWRGCFALDAVLGKS